MIRVALRVALLYGGQSSEHEVSCISAAHVLAAMDQEKFDVRCVGITREGRFLLTEGVCSAEPGSMPSVREEGVELLLRPGGGKRFLAPAGGKEIEVDVVFPVLHGPHGEDGTMQGLLELAGIAYVGPGVLASALGMDKVYAKVAFEARGLPGVAWVAVEESAFRAGAASVSDEVARRLGFPVFTKPARMGSSVGIRKVKDPSALASALEEAFVYDSKAIIEQGVDAREIECAVLGNEHPEASLPGEILPGAEFYDYWAKYTDTTSQVLIPAPLDEATANEVRRLAVEAFRAVGAQGLARVDFFLDRLTGQLLLNEINTLPGFTPISMFPKLWQASGLSYPALIERLVDLALERHGRARKAASPPRRES